MTSSIKATVRGLTLLAGLCGIGCATQQAIEVESPNALRSVNGASTVAAVHHDAPPSESGAAFVVPGVKGQEDDKAFTVTHRDEAAPETVTKLSHGF